MEKQGPPPAYTELPQEQAYPPQGGFYPPQGGAYPPQGGAYPSQGQGYPTQQYPTQQGTIPVVVTTQPHVMSRSVFHEMPVPMTCTQCGASVVTATEYETGMLTWMIAGMLCLFGCWPCCLIPFCVDGCKDVIHSCPNCKTRLGVYRRVS